MRFIRQGVALMLGGGLVCPVLTVLPAQAQPPVAEPETAGTVKTPSAPEHSRNRGNGPAHQAAQARFQPVEQLTVTGSYLQGGRKTSPNPVQTITGKEIQRSAVTSLGDYLQRMPSIGSSGSPNSLTNGGKGASCTDLRNLGQGRVLVLIDGHRATLNAGSECVDLNTIPLQQIEKVEILKDGGSGLYGADAVAGVINIHLRHDLTGSNITMRGSIAQAGDARGGEVSAYHGMNFDEGRGNVTLAGSYSTTGPIYNRDRSWSALPQNDNPATGSPSYGSSIIPSGVLINPQTGQKMVPDGQGGFRRFTRDDLYNFARYSTIMNRHDDGTASLDAHERFSRFVTLYGTMRYSHTLVERTQSPAPVQGSVPPSTLPSSWLLPAASPYNPWGRDASIIKRMEDVGPRRNHINTDTWTFLPGLKGQLGAGWDYDLSYTYGRSHLSSHTQDMINYRNLLETTGTRQLDVTDSRSPVVYDPGICQAAQGCVLQNPFAPYSQQAKDHVRFTQKDRATYQLRDTMLRLWNPHLFALPWMYGGPVGVAAGMEHRGEQLSYHPDALVAQGASTGAAGAYTGGGFTVSEGYGEIQLPLLRRAPLARDLTVDLQGRVSSYSHYGTPLNWKTGLHWAPVQDVAFRGTLGTSFRQPGLYDVYGGQTLSYASASDPCAHVGSYGSRAGAVQARCQKEGINPASFTSSLVGQLPTLSGGNPRLGPEYGRTATVGMDITPHSLRALRLSVDYWHYSLRDMISTLSTQTLLDGCYTGSEPDFCSAILPRSSSGQITAIKALPQNVGALKTDGLDFSLHYSLPLGDRDQLSLHENTQYLLNYRQKLTRNGSWQDYTGRLLYLNGSGRPREQHYISTTWRHDHVSLIWMTRLISGMRMNDGHRDLDPATSGRTHVGGTILHDVTVSGTWHQFQLMGGISNLFNRRPPFVPDGAFNTAFSQYSGYIAGRSFFLQMGADF
ncbi:TonB-dependent receptor domain-containing protein [Bombella apis]|uniref:TonB-dependent receptor domain-containing protein n=1 Tax=Bombella apis TaxID=1785988 RepID=UPI0024A8F38F|nr:TonB-dependent receptor [Bombella apis]